MDRRALISAYLGSDVGTLWCPLLTHYCVRDGRVAVDRRRMAAQLRTLAPYVNHFLLGGSTGDGWELTPTQFNDLLEFARHESYWAPDTRFLVGALAGSTAEVIRRVQMIQSRLGGGAAPHFAGLAICPPVDEHATQLAIREHYERILPGTQTPVAVYQLPQITRCQIEPPTFASLAAAHPNVVMFKDSSGIDAVATAGLELDGVLLVRGAEGDYCQSLRSGGGRYDGLLVATANVVAFSLSNIIEMARIGERELAERRSASLTQMVERLFRVVERCEVGNAFSNLARAIDHVLAHGSYWESVAPPSRYDGSPLPADVLAEAAAIYDREEGIPERGYFVHREAAVG